MPRLQQAIKDSLPHSEMLSNLTADEVMALGCCNQAAVIGETWDPSCELKQVSVPALVKPISIKVSLIYRNSLYEIYGNLNNVFSR